MNNRPVLNIPTTRVEKLHDVISVAIVIGSFVYALVVWPQLPDTIPIHFNGAGQADGWGGKMTLLLLPIIGFCLYIILTVARRFPHRFNYMVEITEQNAHRQYVSGRLVISWIKVQILLLFGYLEWLFIQSAWGIAPAKGLWVVLTLAVVVVGTAVFYTVRSLRTS